jgi:hypothetical protein
MCSQRRFVQVLYCQAAINLFNYLTPLTESYFRLTQYMNIVFQWLVGSESEVKGGGGGEATRFCRGFSSEL